MLACLSAAPPTQPAVNPPPAQATALSPTLPRDAAATTPTLPLLEDNPAPTEAPATVGESWAQALQTEFSNLYQKVNPGVVNIAVGPTRTQEGSVGSGWLFDTRGHIVTNNHVVANASEVIVTFYDDFQAIGRVIGSDPYSDLAVIQVDSLPPDVHPLELGMVDQVQVGDLVAAIGSPFGLGSTLTIGVVSALGRDIPALVSNYSIPQAIQTDAAVNPGNSGGPLLNLQGQVIGVNSQIASGGARQSAGVGFAIPINVVKLVVPALIENGEYTWPYLGVSGTSISLFLQQANQLETQKGAYIVQVISGGPADRAGLRGAGQSAVVMGVQVPVGGDVVTAFNGVPVASYDELLALIAQNQPGETISLTVLRSGQEGQIQVTLGARPRGEAADFGSPFGP